MTEESREGYVRDLATGKFIDIRKPEEKIRQDYEKVLVQEGLNVQSYQ